MKKVFIGVGHGGRDPGAMGNGLEEKDLNLAMAKACNDLLVSSGVETLMSRTRDEDDDLREEIFEANAYGADYVIDFHTNSASKPNQGDGAECFYESKNADSKELAEMILEEVQKIGQNSRGAKTRLLSSGADYYGILRQTKAPAVLFEAAFINTAADIAIIDTEPEQFTMGEAVAKGILRKLGLPVVYPSETVTPPAEDSISEYLPPRGYFRRNDTGEKIEAINEFFYRVFPGYAGTIGRKAENVRGPLFGANTEAWVKEFQRRTGLEPDGCIGPITLAEMKKFGFKE